MQKLIVTLTFLLSPCAFANGAKPPAEVRADFAAAAVTQSPIAARDWLCVRTIVSDGYKPEPYTARFEATNNGVRKLVRGAAPVDYAFDNAGLLSVPSHDTNGTFESLRRTATGQVMLEEVYDLNADELAGYRLVLCQTEHKCRYVRGFDPITNVQGLATAYTVCQ